ncbi:hypothetical protein Dsin_019526 [Dipteronia sinensis]|uniref:Uncharacterized protein n=1 Tax=Dipteronia sinensis TaxID=43782 RepID=A0AAE0E2T4_9ROSI|nr:hypothetical protein Dsin_019526 [Dipteronia sinensis]
MLLSILKRDDSILHLALSSHRSNHSSATSVRTQYFVNGSSTFMMVEGSFKASTLLILDSDDFKQRSILSTSFAAVILLLEIKAQKGPRATKLTSFSYLHLFSDSPTLSTQTVSAVTCIICAPPYKGDTQAVGWACMSGALKTLGLFLTPRVSGNKVFDQDCKRFANSGSNPFNTKSNFKG